MNDQLADLQQLISLSRLMLEQAQSSLWDEVSELEERRRMLMTEFFLIAVPDGLSGAVAEGIQSIMAIDRELMELGRVGKLELEQVLRQIDQGRKAVKAYSS